MASIILMKKKNNNLKKPSAAPAGDSSNSPALFEAELKRHDDILYGVAIFFECISLIHKESDVLISRYKTDLGKVIQSGTATAQNGWKLLDRTKKDPQYIPQLESFEIIPCNGYPEPEELTKRAEILVSSYSQLFPGRPREKEFTKQEIFQLIKSASGKLS